MTAGAGGTMREDTVQSAVRFLRDPAVEHASLARKTAFLESKGLAPAEIDEAIRRVSQSTANTSSTAPNPAPASGPPSQLDQLYPPMPAPLPPPPPPQYGWKDYTLATVGTVGAGYALAQLFRHVVQPLIGFPAAEQIARDKAAVVDQLTRNSSAIDKVEAETARIARSVDDQTTTLHGAVLQLTTALAHFKEFRSRQELEMKRLRDEVDAVKKVIPRVIDRARDADRSVIADLQSEVKSLRTLLASFGDATAAASRPIAPGAPSLASIPAPLAYATTTSTTASNSALQPSPSGASRGSNVTMAALPRPASLGGRPSSVASSVDTDATAALPIAGSNDGNRTEQASTQTQPLTQTTVVGPRPNGVIPTKKIPQWQLDLDEDVDNVENATASSIDGHESPIPASHNDSTVEDHA